MNRYEIGGRVCIVWDGLLAPADLQPLVSALDSAPFRRTEIATPQTPNQRHFVCEFAIENLSHLSVNGLMQSRIRELDSRPFRAYRAYTNLTLQQDTPLAHTDCAEDQNEITALWYFCNEWQKDWGGETVFYDNGEIALSLLPRPGRLVMFDSRIMHSARPPTNAAQAARYTFAVKFELAS